MFQNSLRFLDIAGTVTTDDVDFHTSFKKYTASMLTNDNSDASLHINTRVLFESNNASDERAWTKVGYRVDVTDSAVRENTPPLKVTATVVSDGLDIEIHKIKPKERPRPKPKLKNVSWHKQIRNIVRGRARLHSQPLQPPEPTKPKPQSYQKLIRYSWHFPLFALLESRGFGFLHASAVAREGRALILAGLPGCGKSALILGLLSLQEDWKLVTDNYLLFDGDCTVHGFPEPLRTNEKRFADLWGAPFAWQPTFSIEERTHFVPSLHQVAVTSRPGALFLVARGEKTEIEEIGPDHFLQQLITVMQWSAHEFHWPTFGSFLPWLSSDLRNTQSQTSNLRNLVAQTPCYSLTVGTDKTLRDVVRDVSSYV